MSQKLLHLFLHGLLMLSLIVPNHLHATEPALDGDEVIIIVHQQYGQNIGGPRTHNATRIEAWYSYDTSSVSAFLYNAGDVVEVKFYNVFTQELYSYEISGSGLSVMPISGSSGYWTVSFTLSAGAVYEGEFTLY